MGGMDFSCKIMGTDRFGGWDIMLRFISLAALAVGAALAAACGSSSETGAAQGQAEVVEVAEVRRGPDIGNRLPPFELVFTENGEKLTADALLENGRPAFLFFFATT